jgi:hypothetical protein
MSSLASLLDTKSQVIRIQQQLMNADPNKVLSLKKEYGLLTQRFYDENSSEIGVEQYSVCKEDIASFIAFLEHFIRCWKGIEGGRIIAKSPNPRRHPNGKPINIHINWGFPQIYEYWDWRKDAIYIHSQEIETYDEDKKADVYATIQFSIESHVKDFSDNQAAMCAMSMVEDLYKSLNKSIIYLSDSVLQYLQDSAGTFCNLLTKKGFVIHYLIDNTFEPTERGMAGPLKVFRQWFYASGLLYICPQHIAFDIMEKDGTQEKYFELLPQYIAEARLIANSLIDRCHQDKRHYVLLDTDSVPDSFQKSSDAIEEPYVVTIFRNDSPIQGSKAKLWCHDKTGVSLLKDV